MGNREKIAVVANAEFSRQGGKMAEKMKRQVSTSREIPGLKWGLGVGRWRFSGAWTLESGCLRVQPGQAKSGQKSKTRPKSNRNQADSNRKMKSRHSVILSKSGSAPSRLGVRPDGPVGEPVVFACLRARLLGLDPVR